MKPATHSRYFFIINLTTVMGGLFFAGVSFAQTVEERRAAVRQRAEAGARWLEDLLADAQAEMEAQQAALAAGRTADPTAAQRTAEAAVEAKRVWFEQEIRAWLHQDDRLADGSAPTPADRRAMESAQLRTLAQALHAKAERDRRAVEEYCAARGLPRVSVLPDGRLAMIVAIENGIPLVQTVCNVEAADTVSTDELWPGGNTGLGLTGTNVVIGLWDVGDLRQHVQLGFFQPGGPRVTDMDSTTFPSFHSTHVAGTLIGSGECGDCCDLCPPEFAGLALGMAHRGRLLAWDFENDTVEMAGTLTTNALRLSNHSYGFQAGWGVITNRSIWFGDIAISTNESFRFGFYSTNTQPIDQIAHTVPTYLPVWAAANERATNAGTGSPLTPPELGYTTYSNGVEIISHDPRPKDGDPSGFDTLLEVACAKNVLTVGAVHPITNGYTGPGSVVVAPFSSFGPTDDGRIKPDLVADGVDVLSLEDNNCCVTTLSGTSMATPNVCGSLGLLLELHDRLYGTNQPMRASTIKGLAIHTADEAGGFPGPDYRFGWGLFNASKAALLVASNHASGSLAHMKEVRLTGGDFIEFPVISAGNQPLIVTIEWNDPPGTIPPISLDPTNSMLVNDLDLRVISPAGVTNFPWLLDPVARTNAATTGDNFRDNAEQSAITNTTAGLPCSCHAQGNQPCHRSSRGDQ